MSEETMLVHANSYVQHSEKVGALMKALCKAQSELEPALKNAVNPDKRNKYADLSEVLQCTKVLNANGVVVMQFPDADGACVSVTTRLALGGTEEWIQSTLHLISMTRVKGGGWEQSMDAQGLGSAITYSRRYSLKAILGIPEEDDDGEKASKQYKQSREEARADAEAQRQAVIDERLAAERPRTPPPPPPSVIAEKLRTEPDRFKRLAMFQELKRDMEEFGGEEGVKAYYQIMKDAGGVEHANQFKNLADAIKAGVGMESWIKQRIADNDAKLEAEMRAKDEAMAK